MKKDYRGRTNWKLVDPEYPHTSKQALHRQYKRPAIIVAVIIVLVLIMVSLLHKRSPNTPTPTPPSTVSIPLQIPSAHS